ncbi:helix-turn-helix domain-containing protein [Actinomadura sp. NPDC047616]|uniref:TetR/AcrR family transcriptional regulator n=1 Tax=Actinomadura sp. NPDC047616 TaxID=3155914 RepID=UPI0034002CB1
MAVNEHERERAILDAAAELLLRLGYNKLTMGDVADAAALHRGLVYVRFKSKDELVEAVMLRELNRYADAWREQLENDPRGGDVASVYRAMAHALKTLPLAAAIIARDPEVFGKYLRKPSNVFQRRPDTGSTREFLRVMRDAGAIRRDADIRAVAYILDALTPALRRTFSRAVPVDADEPSTDELVEALADMLERALPPADGGDLAAGKALLLGALEQARSDITTEPAPQKGRPS